MKQKTQKPTI